MESVFHEKQEGSLCAQHCLNALLQGSYFTPVDLATLAQQMDEEERRRMAESGVDSEEYKRFLQQPSGNMDDSGYFSVQVISSALEVWGLDLVPYNSTEIRAMDAQTNPAGMQAFICNYRDHWFTIRKLGNQWFNLNSLLSGPELITTTYLAMFLAQLQQEGYSIFVVCGELPECIADGELLLRPAVQNVRPKTITVTKVIDQEEDPELQRALRLSLGQNTTPEVVDVEEELELEKALRLSLGQEENKDTTDSDEEEQLRQAVLLSMQTSDHSLQSTSTSDVDPVELRRRRLAYLENPGVNT